MDERALNDLRNLATRDAELERRARRLRELDHSAAEIRHAAKAIDAFFSRYPAEETARGEEVASAEAELAQRRAELAEAQSELGEARDDIARELAQRAVARADDHIGVASARLERARQAREELEHEAHAMPRAVPDLEARATAIADEAADVPEPGEGPRALVDWASRAHAELFVAAGHIDTQRDRLIREANELASALTGEATYGSTAAQALRRAEENTFRNHPSA
jgi:chromosome segregation ATPase